MRIWKRAHRWIEVISVTQWKDFNDPPRNKRRCTPCARRKVRGPYLNVQKDLETCMLSGFSDGATYFSTTVEVMSCVREKCTPQDGFSLNVCVCF